MKYYVIEISDGDTKIKGKGMYEFDNRTKAIAEFHSKLGVAMKSELYTYEMLTVINSAGGIEENPVVFERKEKTVETE